jgi:hypothetical protein
MLPWRLRAPPLLLDRELALRELLHLKKPTIGFPDAADAA